MLRTGRGKMFRISKPYGYYMEDVEAAINKYNEVVDQLQKVIINKDKIIEKIESDNLTIKGELQRMQLEMSMLELPDMNHVQEQIILNQFKGQKTFLDTPSKTEPVVDLPIIGIEDNEPPVDVSKTTGTVFDIVD